MKYFLRTNLIFVLILTCISVSYAQSKKQETVAIKYARSVMVSNLEKEMPRQRFDTWFRRTVGPKMKITWEVNDCGEQTGTPVDRGRDFPMCVEGMAESLDVYVAVSIMVGTFKRGIVGKPVIRSYTLNQEGEPAETVNSLRDLQEKLNKVMGE